MRLTKHVHACVTLEKDGHRLLIDPGTFTPDARELIAAAEAILITHEHPDHFDEAAITDAIGSRPDLAVHGPGAVVDRWHGREGQVVALAEGDRRTIAGFDVAAFGELHASIHRDIPQVANVGYVIDGSVYHPGDAYHVPPVPVATLLLPTSGPWTSVGQAADFVRAVGPERSVQIHEAMLSELGQQSTARFLGPDMLTDVPVTILEPGSTIEL